MMSNSLTKSQQRVLKICIDLQEKYGNDFHGWVRDHIDFTGLKHDGLTGQQEEIANWLIANKKVCVAAGGGIGKTALAALIIIWFLCCHTYSKVPTTAPGGAQLQDALWAEIAKWLKRCDLQPIFDLKKERLYIKGFREWFAVARTVPKDNRIINDTMAGFHAPWMLAVVDEASGVPDPVYTAIEGTMTDDQSYILLISNPVSTGGYFYDTINDPEGKGGKYKVLFFDARNSPLVDSSFEESIIARYGKDSPMYIAKVLGLPINELDTVIVAPDKFEKIVNHNKQLCVGTSIVGIDVGGPKDLSVFCYKTGASISQWNEYQGKDDEFLYNEAMKVFDIDPLTVFVVDANGIGAGLYNRLVKTTSVKVIGYMGGEKPADENLKSMYRHKRAYGYHLLQKCFANLHFPVVTPERLKKELANLKLIFEPGMSITMEPKEKFKKRLGFSPDYADALMLTVFADVLTTKMSYHKPFVPKNSAAVLVRPPVHKRRGKYSIFM